MYLCRLLIVGARLGELSEHSAEMRRGQVKSRLLVRVEWCFRDGKVGYEREQLFVRDVGF